MFDDRVEVSNPGGLLPIVARDLDVMVSNCVLNLLPQKGLIFKEIYRVLKPGGHFCISVIQRKGIGYFNTVFNGPDILCCLWLGEMVALLHIEKASLASLALY